MGGGRLNKSSKEKNKGQQSTDSPLSLFLSSLVCHVCRSAMLAVLPCLPLCHACRVMVDRALWNHEPKPWIPPLSCFTHIFHHIKEKVANTEEDIWNFSTNDRPGTGNCGDWRKPQMNEVLCECTLLTWHGPWEWQSLPCIGEESLVLVCVWIIVEWVENVQTDPLQELFLRRWPKSASVLSCM